MHLNLSWPSWPLVETWWAKTNQECKSQQVMENTQAAPICMCADALRICFSKKAPAGERWGQTEYSDLLPLSIRDVLCCCDSSYSGWSVLASKDKRDSVQPWFVFIFTIYNEVCCGSLAVQHAFQLCFSYLVAIFSSIQRVALSSSHGLLYILYSGAMCPALSLCNQQHWNCEFVFTLGPAFFYQFGKKWGLDPFYCRCKERGQQGESWCRSQM